MQFDNVITYRPEDARASAQRVRGPNCLRRLVRCVRALGLRLGWRYWRIENRALVNPWLVLDWAEACEREAAELDAKREGLLAAQHRAWAAELRASYARFMSSPNDRNLPRDEQRYE